MQINGPVHVHGPQPINSPHRTAAPQPTTQPERLSTVDQLDISREGELASRIHDIPDVRTDKVEAIKAQIASGLYDSDDKIEAALDRLLDELQ